MSTDSTALSRLVPFSLRDAFSEPEQLLTAYFHESSVGLCIHDTEFRYLAINPALAAMHGVPAEAHLGKTLREIVGDLADKVEPEFKRILATALPVVGLEISGRLPSRSEVGYWSANYFPIKAATGKVKQIGVVVIEITRRRELEQSLRQLADSLQQEKVRLQALQEVDSALGATLDPGELLNRISVALQKAVPHTSLGIHLYDEGAAVLRDHSPVSEAKKRILPPGGVLTLHESIAGEVFLERKPRVVEHAALVNVGFPIAKRAVAEGVRSLCFVPLSTGKEPLGVLVLSSRTDHAFGKEQLDILEPAAAAIAQAVGNAQAHSALEQKNSRLQALRDIEDALACSLELNQVLPAVSRYLHQTLPHDYVSIYVYDVSRGGLRDYAGTSSIKKKIIPASGLLPLDASLTGRAFSEGKARVYDHGELLKVAYPTTQCALEVGIRSACFIPLSAPRGRVGVLTVSSNRDSAFRPEDLEFLHQVAAALGQALQNALVHKDLRDEKRRLQALLNINTALAANRNVAEIFPSISACLRRILHQEYAAFLLKDEKNGLLVRQSLDFPMGKGLCDEMKVTPSNGPVGMSLDHKTPMTFSRAELQDFGVEMTEGLLAEGIRSMYCVPLLRSKTALGALVLGSTRDDAFRTDDLLLVNQAAGQMAVAMENHRVSVEIEVLKNRLASERKYLEGEVRSEPHFEEIIGESVPLRQALRQVETVAQSDATVLILGETGTGKELVARAIHRASNRHERRFIKLNCAAIPTGLLESELFGHEKGAFTGAVARKIGHLELADGGTLFLDEVGEISMELQPKLLRVLQDHEFERLGGTKTIKVDLRLVAATNRDLAQSVANSEFRSDLFYRLNVFPIRMPSLRKRREDIPLLVRHFVRYFARRHNRNIETIPTEIMNALMNWDWPGNVRELENFIERSLILSEGTALAAPLGELQLAGRNPASTPSSLENAEREHILRVLRETAGVISGPNGAAHRLGLKRSTLQSKMHRLGIRRKDYSGQPPS